MASHEHTKVVCCYISKGQSNYKNFFFFDISKKIYIPLCKGCKTECWEIGKSTAVSCREKPLEKCKCKAERERFEENCDLFPIACITCVISN